MSNDVILSPDGPEVTAQVELERPLHRPMVSLIFQSGRFIPVHT